MDVLKREIMVSIAGPKPMELRTGSTPSCHPILQRRTMSTNPVETAALIASQIQEAGILMYHVCGWRIRWPRLRRRVAGRPRVVVCEGATLGRNKCTLT